MKEIEKGFIALYRQFTEWEWYDDANTMRLFIHCLLLANYKDKKWRGKLIKRGSFITSQPKLAHSLKLSIMQIRNSLRKLKTTGELTVYSTADYSVIVVNNYNQFQENNSLTNRQKTKKEQSSNSLITTTNNINKEINNNIISLSNNKKNISEREREILKKYLLNKKRTKPIEDIDAYISLLVKNGDVQLNLNKAIKWQEKQEKKKQELIIAAETKKEEPLLSKEEADAAFNEFKKSFNNLRKERRF